MKGLDSSQLLAVADRTDATDWISRGLVLLACAWPEASPQQRAAVPIGTRDRLLIALRIHTFGPTMEFVARCQQCGEDLEATVDLTAVLADHRDLPPAEVELEVDGRSISVRNPSSLDLQEAFAAGAGAADAALLERCVAGAEGVHPAELRALAARALADADPLADVRFQLHCVACGRTTSAVFDIVSCFWAEVERGARSVTREVHDLASVYGWSEADILAMPGARRARYLAIAR